MLHTWPRDCPSLKCCATLAGTYDIPQITSVPSSIRPIGRAVVGELRPFSGTACADAARVRPTTRSATTVEGKCGRAPGRHQASICDLGRHRAVERAHRTQILGYTESRAPDRVCGIERCRLRRDSRQPAERRTGIKSDGSPLRTLHRRIGGKFRRRNRGRASKGRGGAIRAGRAAFARQPR